MTTILDILEKAVAEGALHLVGLGARPHVEVLRLAPEQEVAHPSTHEVRREAEVGETVQHTQGILVDVLPGNAVIRPRADHGADHFSHFSAKDAEHEFRILCQKRLTESSAFRQHHGRHATVVRVGTAIFGPRIILGGQQNG